jgi:hypothetical protein
VIVAPDHTQWHTHTHTQTLSLSLSVRLPWTRNRPSQRPLPDNTQHPQVPLTGFEPTILASEGPQNYSLNCAATWISLHAVIREEILCNSEQPISWPNPETGPSQIWKKPLNGESQIFVFWRRRRDSLDTVTVCCVLHIHCALSSVNPVNSKLYPNNKLSPVPALQLKPQCVWNVETNKAILRG